MASFAHIIDIFYMRRALKQPPFLVVARTVTVQCSAQREKQQQLTPAAQSALQPTLQHTSS
jgi:hypothetical protein